MDLAQPLTLPTRHRVHTLTTSLPHGGKDADTPFYDFRKVKSALYDAEDFKEMRTVEDYDKYNARTDVDNPENVYPSSPRFPVLLLS